MKKLDIKKHIPKLVVALLCVFFVGGVGIGANSLLEMEGTEVPYEPAEDLSVRPETPAEIAAYLDLAIQKAIDLRPKLSTEEKLSIDTETITADNPSEMLLAAAKTMTDGLEEAVENSYEKLEIDYSAGLDGVLKLLNLNTDDIVSAECVKEYYQCPICSERFDEKRDICDECGGTEPLNLRFSDEYAITISLRDASDSFTRNFTTRDSDAVDAIVKDRLEGYFVCDGFELLYHNAEIVARVNRLTDKLVSLELKTAVDVKTPLTFQGAYDYLGTVSTSFTVNDALKYSFSWPALELSSHKMSIAHGVTEVLRASLICDDPTAYEVRWSCSDDSILTVDSDGYIKASKTDGIVTVKAEFDFNGETYSDTCEVYVKTSVESIDISKRRLSLDVGETYQQTSSVSSDDSTIQTVKWYTQDESIAKVNADGLITAVSPGNTVVYALSDDGYYKASCKVEVRQ